MSFLHFKTEGFFFFLVKKDSIREGDFHFTFKNAENELLHVIVDDMLLTELLITHLTLKTEFGWNCSLSSSKYFLHYLPSCFVMCLLTPCFAIRCTRPIPSACLRFQKKGITSSYLHLKTSNSALRISQRQVSELQKQLPSFSSQNNKNCVKNKAFTLQTTFEELFTGIIFCMDKQSLF